MDVRNSSQTNQAHPCPMLRNIDQFHLLGITSKNFSLHIYTVLAIVIKEIIQIYFIGFVIGKINV
jgi:hypothetical protein